MPWNTLIFRIYIAHKPRPPLIGALHPASNQAHPQRRECGQRKCNDACEICLRTKWIAKPKLPQGADIVGREIARSISIAQQHAFKREKWIHWRPSCCPRRVHANGNGRASHSIKRRGCRQINHHHHIKCKNTSLASVSKNAQRDGDGTHHQRHQK